MRKQGAVRFFFHEIYLTGNLSFLSQLHIGLVQFSHSVRSNSATPWTAACQASLFITNSRSLLKLMSIELVMPSYHLILYHPLFFLPSIFPSIRVFSNESVLRIRWPKYWSFSFSISPFRLSEWSPFRMKTFRHIQRKTVMWSWRQRVERYSYSEGRPRAGETTRS